MAEIPKIHDLDVSGPEPIHPEIQRISVPDHVNGLHQYNAHKSDSFAIEIDTFAHAINKDSNTDSRITLQRSLSRKCSQRQGEKKVSCSTTLNEREAGPATTSSPKGFSTPEKAMAMGTVDHTAHIPQVHHQITITSSSTIGSTPTESKTSVLRRSSFRRSSTWIVDPKRVLFLFATLSSLGTMLLIYFTLSMSKRSAEE